MKRQGTKKERTEPNTPILAWRVVPKDRKNTMSYSDGFYLQGGLAKDGHEREDQPPLKQVGVEGLFDSRAQATIVLEIVRFREQAHRALARIAQNSHTVDFLRKNDPKALKQCEEAFEESERLMNLRLNIESNDKSA